MIQNNFRKITLKIKKVTYLLSVEENLQVNAREKARKLGKRTKDVYQNYCP